MISQDRFVVVAEVDGDRIGNLRDKLADMTRPDVCGSVDPENAILPFARYPTIHFARLVVLDDHTLADREVYGLSAKAPILLLFLADCDGNAGELLDRIAREQPRLAEIFAFCVDPPRGPLGPWLKRRRVRPVASYVNWIGRTVAQAREEADLRTALRAALPKAAGPEPRALWRELKARVGPAVRLTPLKAPTPMQRLARWMDLLWPPALALACLLLFPKVTLAILLIGVVAFLVLLRRRELSDPVQQDPYDPDWVKTLRRGEDHDVTNPYTAMGSIRPGGFRLVLAYLVLSSVNWASRNLANRGALGRIGTIHFAQWIFLDRYRRMVFCSNYDGLHEAYMDDFINKAAFGLNFTFSHAIAYPQTDWLIGRGAWREQEFKRFQRHHQIPTDVWYSACPGHTLRDLASNSLVRNGFERDDLSDDEIRRWLAEI